MNNFLKHTNFNEADGLNVNFAQCHVANKVSQCEPQLVFFAEKGYCACSRMSDMHGNNWGR